MLAWPHVLLTLRPLCSQGWPQCELLCSCLPQLTISSLKTGTHFVLISPSLAHSQMFTNEWKDGGRQELIPGVVEIRSGPDKATSKLIYNIEGLS